MAIVINGSGTVTGISVGGLPDGIVDRDTLATSIDDSGDATAITIDSSENVGIGVTPESDWRTSDTVLALDTTARHFVTSGNHYVTQNNAKLDTSGNPEYITTNPATRYQQLNTGVHTFDVAASGSADAAITWITAMTIDNSGFLTLAPSTSMSSSGVLNLRRNDSIELLKQCRLMLVHNTITFLKTIRE